MFNPNTLAFCLVLYKKNSRFLVLISLCIDSEPRAAGSAGGAGEAGSYTEDDQLARVPRRSVVASQGLDVCRSHGANLVSAV